MLSLHCMYQLITINGVVVHIIIQLRENFQSDLDHSRGHSVQENDEIFASLGISLLCLYQC